MRFFADLPLAAVLGVFVLACAAFAAYTYYQRRVPGQLVRALLEAGAHDEASAKSFDELGIAPTAALLSALRKTSPLRRIVCVLGVTEQVRTRIGGRRVKQDPFRSARFYLPKTAEDKARALYDRNASALGGILITLGALAIALLLYTFLPLFFEIGA